VGGGALLAVEHAAIIRTTPRIRGQTHEVAALFARCQALTQPPLHAWLSRPIGRGSVGVFVFVFVFVASSLRRFVVASSSLRRFFVATRVVHAVGKE
jgi:hypothetical protein